MNTGFATLVGLELRRSAKGAALWTILLAGLVIMGLAFFPALAGSFRELEGLFENPMMSGVLAAFGADVDALTSLSGFYVTYASIYVTLLGCVYAGILGGRSLADDEASGLAEYLLTRPVGRGMIFAAKATALLLILVALNLVIFAAGMFGLEVFGSSAPLLVYPRPTVVERVARAAEEFPDAFAREVRLDRKLFDEAAVAMARRQLATAAPEDVASAGIDAATIQSLMDALEALGPEGLIESVRENPKRYTDILGSRKLSEDELLEELNGLEAELDAMWTAFQSGGAIDMFRAAPEPFLLRMADAESAEADGGLSRTSLGASLSRIGVDAEAASRLLLRYPRGGIATLSVYTFLAMLVFAFVGLCISSLVRKPETALGAALAVVFIAYFIDVISQAVGATGIAVLSPFAMIGDDLTDPAYRLAPGRVAYFVGIAAVSLTSGLLVFRAKDIHVP